jgi:hypothetical protein
MAITVQSLIDSMRQVGLDAEGGDYYDTDIDLIPALNASVRWLVQVISSGYGAKKFTEEVFGDLTMSRVFQTSQFSRVHFDSATLGHLPWTILAIYPKPTTSPTATPSTLTPSDKSLYRDDLAHVSSVYDATRLTVEEWAGNALNPFAPGNIKETCTELMDYAYLSYFDYSGTGYTTVKEIEVRPALDNELVTIFYAKKPTEITTPFASNPAQTVEFPESLANLIFEKALQFVSYKQGDETNLYRVTSNDINVLLSATM